MPILLTQAEVDTWVSECGKDRLRVGYTCGAFDILHAGHVDYLEKARKVCDRLLVSVNSDRSIQEYKNPSRPINPQQERIKVVGALRCVDAVTSLDAPRPLEQLLRWQPKFYIKGGDYSSGNLRSADAVEAYGGEVVLIPVQHLTSTTALIDRILAAEAHEAPQHVQRDAKGIVFLDRDGTLIPDFGFVHDAGEVSLLPGVGEGLARLQALGFRLVIVTNQGGIGLGYYTERDFFEVNQALFRLLTPYGVRIDRVLFCPHSLADNCECRKPGPLLLKRAMERFQATPEECFMIGDRQGDADAGIAAGCQSILLGATCSFADAVEWIVVRTDPHRPF